MKPGERFNPYKRFRNIYIPLGIAASTKLSAAAKLTYGALARRAGPNGKCFPKHETLRRDLGLKLSNLRRYLRELRGFGLVEWEHHGTQNHYFFLEHSTLEECSRQETLDTEECSPADTLGEQECSPVDTQELPSGDTLGSEECPSVDTPIVIKREESPNSRSSSKETGEEPASAAALPDGWGKSFQKLQQSFPTISVNVFVRLVQDKVKPAGFTDDEFAAGIEEHGGRILSLHSGINPIIFGLKVIDSITEEARLSAQMGASSGTQPKPLPPHEPKIELSIVGLCPKHKHEVVWTPARRKEVCVECTEPPGELAAEAKERVERWFEAEKEIGFGSGPRQLTERLATL